MKASSFWERIYNKRKRRHYKALMNSAKKVVSAPSVPLTSRGQRPLCIAMFTDTFPPDINGVSVSVASLASSLEDMGHKVYIFTTSEQTTFSGIDINNRVIRIPSVRLKKFYGYGMSAPISYSAISYLKRLNVDVIHIHTDFSVRILGEICAKVLGVPVIYTYHTMYIDYTNYVSKYTRGHFENLMKKFVVWFSRTSNSHCANVIAPSEKTRDALLKYGLSCDISVVPTGIPLEKFKQPTSQKTLDLKKRFGLDNKFTVLYLGRIAKEKSIEVVIDAIKDVYAIDQNVVLAIAGYGPYEEQLRSYVAEKSADKYVTFLGKSEREEVPDYYKIGDIFVSASQSETQGLTYIEALSSGLPLVARYDECIKDLIVTSGENKNGDFFENSCELADLIIKYKNMDENTFKKVSDNARSSTDKYSMKTFGRKIINIYEHEIIKRNSDYITQ